MTNEKQEPNTEATPIEKPWAKPASDVLGTLEVDADTGLGPQEVEERRERYGPNQLRDTETRSAWSILIEQFKSLIVLLLGIAALVSFAFGEWIEGVAIAAVIIINAAIGFVTELRAVRSMEALQELGTVTATVLREGQPKEIPAEEVVPGDILVINGGDVVTADARIVEASRLQANESALTGESVPVGKQSDSLDGDIVVAERKNMLFKGTAVTRGSGRAVVVATGMDTELGEISSLVEQAEEEATPLEQRLQELGRRLIWVTVGLGAIVAVAGIIAGRELLLMVETGIALAVASIPEGLPIVATVALARGMWRMAKRNALINRLSAVETLGATNVILTDKTGTLTENRMTLREVRLSSETISVSGEGLETEGEFKRDGEVAEPKDGLLRKALEIGVLCNEASLDAERDDEKSAVGDPSEVALLVAGVKGGIRRDDLLERYPQVRQVAFDPEIKMMATYHESDGGYRVAVKGALEAVLESSSSVLTSEGEKTLDESTRERWKQQNEEMAQDGLRVLALATKQVDDEEAEPYKDLTLLGLTGLLDPPREEVESSITSAKGAGVRVVMVTGDQPATALSIAKSVGITNGDAQVVHGREVKARDELSDEERERLLDAQIFARFEPEQKLDLIALHQGEGAVVAMTGDGVNDAPALKKADIGVAMGQRGTQVAREASDMVLEDDAFSSIVAAIEQGRTIFGNIRKFVLYLLSCNVAEVLSVALASIANVPLPVRPLQILFLNLVTDVFPALALGVGRGEAEAMNRPPREPGTPVLEREHWIAVGAYGFLITVATLGSLAIALLGLGLGPEEAGTLSFLTLAFGQLWHVFNMRANDSEFLRNDITENPYVWGALALCVGLLILAVYLPGLSGLLKTHEPSLQGWLVVLGMSFFPWLVGQVYKQLAD